MQVFLVAQPVMNLPAKQATQVQILGWEDPLEKEIATHSSILAWEIPQTEEPCRLQSTGPQESDTTSRLNHHHHQKQHTKYAGLMIGSGTQFQPSGNVEVEGWEGHFPHTHK